MQESFDFNYVKNYPCLTYILCTRRFGSYTDIFTLQVSGYHYIGT